MPPPPSPNCLDQCRSKRDLINMMLPDEVLLHVFGFSLHMDEDDDSSWRALDAWQSLVHVCQRWRSIVFGSPHRLGLQLNCTGTARMRSVLDVWPALPLLLHNGVSKLKDVDAVVAVLKRSDRVKDVNFNIVNSSSFKKKVLAAMKVPFPELTDLRLAWTFGGKMGDGSEPAIVLPDSFLGASAPRLRSLSLMFFAFPGITKLLLSTPHLVDLSLCMPRDGHFLSGYFSPDEFATSLSALTGLKSLSLIFHSSQYRSSQRPSPTTRFVLPVLTLFVFAGCSEFLDKFVAHIDAPRLNKFSIVLFWQSSFDTPQLARFISRTPLLKVLEKARVSFWDDRATVEYSSRISGLGKLEVDILDLDNIALDMQVSSLEKIGALCLPPLSALEDLYVCQVENPNEWLGHSSFETWLGLLRPFTAVKNLYLSDQAVSRIAPALQELVGDRTAEVLPVLKNVFLEQLESSGPGQEGIGRFAAARQLINRPITVAHWK